MATLIVALATMVPGLAEGEDVRRPELPALRGDSPGSRIVEPPDLKIEKAPDSSSLYHQQLLRRVARPLETLSAHEVAAMPGHDLRDHILYEDLNRQVLRSLEKTTKRRVEQYLIDKMALDRVFGGRLSRDRQAAPTQAGMAPGLLPRKRLDVDLRISHALPKLQMNYLTTGGQLNFSVGAHGNVNLGYRDARMQNASIQAGYDGDGGYSLGCSIAF
jgi:hypothetical protein